MRTIFDHSITHCLEDASPRDAASPNVGSVGPADIFIRGRVRGDSAPASGHPLVEVQISGGGEMQEVATKFDGPTAMPVRCCYTQDPVNRQWNIARHFGREGHHPTFVTFENLATDDLQRGIQRECVPRDSEQCKIARPEPTDLCAAFGKLAWPTSAVCSGPP
jgi:hypothetical protein